MAGMMVPQLHLLPSDHRHTAIGTLEALIANIVLEFLVPDGTANRSGQCVIGGIGPDNGAQVRLFGGEEAGTQLSICGQADAVAHSAERLTDGIDEAYFPDAVAEGITTCRFGGIAGGNRHEWAILGFDDGFQFSA